MEDTTEIKNKLEALQQWTSKHEVEDHNRFSAISDSLSDIKENHLAHIQIAMEKMATDYAWIKYLVMGIIAGIGLLAIGFLSK